MKNCRTLAGFEKAIKQNTNCCLRYTEKVYNPIMKQWIVYLKSGCNLIITDITHNRIKNYLQKI